MQETIDKAAATATTATPTNTSIASATTSDADVMAAASARAFDVRVAVVGNVDAGKSTLIGVLTGGALDDGRGGARTNVFMHAHEANSGRTSSISQHIMGFDDTATAVHQTTPASSAPAVKTRAWQKVVAASRTIVTFVDLAGHERYLKTTIAGLTGSFPDYVMIVVNALAGVSKMTKEHLGVVLALNLPFCVVVTKIDMAPPNVLARTKKQLNAILKHQQVGKLPCTCRVPDDVALVLSNVAATQSHRMCPVFYVSNVTGACVDVLTQFIGGLRSIVKMTASKENVTPTTTEDAAAGAGKGKAGVDGDSANGVLAAAAEARAVVARRQALTEYHIDDIFSVTGVGVVVSGTVVDGSMRAGTDYWLGPFSDGAYVRVHVRSVHARRTPVTDAGGVGAGHTCSVAVRAVKRKEPLRAAALRRGMVMLAVSTVTADGVTVPTPAPRSCVRFDAEVLVLHHPTTIKRHYQAVIHCGNIRQPALIERIVPLVGDGNDSDGEGDDDVDVGGGGGDAAAADTTDALASAIRTGDKARVTFRFIVRPEFIRDGLVFIFREGNTKGVGRVLSTAKYAKTSHRVNKGGGTAGVSAATTADSAAAAASDAAAAAASNKSVAVAVS